MLNSPDIIPAVASDSPSEAFILSFAEALLKAQLDVIRDFKRKAQKGASSDSAAPDSGTSKSRSKHLNSVIDILTEHGKPLHISEIISRVKSRFGLALDRESLVSALAKRVVRQDRFCRTAPNTFGLLSYAADGSAATSA
jgi:hypothetical protein